MTLIINLKKDKNCQKKILNKKNMKLKNNKKIKCALMISKYGCRKLSLFAKIKFQTIL